MSEPLSLLVVDDDVPLLRTLEREFTGLGWRVRAVSRAGEALALAGECAPQAIVTDFRCSELGLSFVEQLRQSDAESCIVVASVGLDVRATVSAIRAGADDVLEKPIDALLVDRRLREAIERRRSGRPQTPRDDPASLVLGETPAIRALREQIRTVARYKDLTVMITGETGTGKELVAQAIHALGAARGPFVPINCSAIPETLFESELFGHEAGAFTGARAPHAGLFEVAGNGTLMLDELGEMPSSLQPKLLRAIETRSFRRVGGSRDIPLRARIISATHRRMLGKDSLVRSDLYYRLAGFTIATPALRNRPADIDLLARHFLDGFCQHYGVELRFSDRALEALHAHHWPGNVRELRAVVEQAAVLARDGRVGVAEVVAGVRDRQAFEPDDEETGAGVSGTLRRVLPQEPLRDLERRTIKETWDSTGHNMSAAARALGLPRTTLRDRIRKYGWR
ncbi:MAG TPA: sigma-54 dependent transcriptional regulator [Polyangiaceae bacterium]|nr:sigma-54 dependent transcriptional regulator [Polyangiaceae bacterium]